jgi:hypothetical protein
VTITAGVDAYVFLNPENAEAFCKLVACPAEAGHTSVQLPQEVSLVFLRDLCKHRTAVRPDKTMVG